MTLPPNESSAGASSIPFVAVDPAKNNTDKELRAREYQNELLQRAVQQNIVIALGTGTGKTFIAVMLLSENADKLIYGGKRAIFAVPSVPLVYQQAKYIKRHTNFEVGRYCGETGVDVWQPEKWAEEVKKHHVMVMVYEIFRCALERGYLSADKIAVLIVDECHHARKESPIRFAMHELKRQVKTLGSSAADVRVVGLTASVINITLKESKQHNGSNKAVSIFDEELNEKTVTNLMDPLEESIKELEEIMLDAVVAQPSDLAAVDECGALPEIRTKGYEIHIVDEDLKNALGRNGRAVLSSRAPPLTAEQKHILDRFRRMQLSVETFLNMPEAQKNGKEMAKVLKRKLNQVLETYKELGVLALHNAIFMTTEWLSFTHLTGVPPEIVSPLAHALLIELLTVQRSIKLYYNIQSSSTELAAHDIPVVMGPAVVEMLNLLLENLDRVQKLSAIVFVRRRYAAWALHSLINSASRVPNSRYARLKSTFLVGQGGLTESSTANEFMLDFVDSHVEADVFRGHVVSSDDDRHRSRGGQKELERFRRGEVNILVATSVVEEGLDVPQCNLIIRFNIPSCYRGFIQSKGRARAKNALYYVMTPNCVADLAQNKLDRFRQTYEDVVLRCVDRIRRSLPDVCQLRPSFDAVQHDRQLFPMEPYRNAAGAVLNIGNSTATLYQYCATLKSESGVTLYPYTKFDSKAIDPKEFDRKFGKWGRGVIEEDERVAYYSGAGDQATGKQQVCCTIRLPLNSPMRESVVGEWMPNRSRAKQSACQLACVKLYAEYSELDEHYRPKSRDTWKPELLDDLGMEAAEVEALAALSAVERKENEREDMQFEKRVPRLFMPPNNSPPSNVLYLYAVEISLAKELTGDKATLAYRPETSKHLFGLLVHAPLPNLADFTVFDRDGEMNVCVENVAPYFRDDLKNELMQLVRICHKYIVDVACRYDSIEKTVEFDDTTAMTKHYFVVPLCRDSGRRIIDWNTLRHVKQHIVNKSCACFLAGQNFAGFADAVVRPTYRVQIDRRTSHFIVTAVRSDKSPLSKFDSEKCPTFAKYFEQQYQAPIKDLNQPLLQCVPSPSRLNRLLFERDMKKRVDAIHLVPELVEREPISASLWRQAIMLPSVLHRIESFLIADEVRREWQSRTFIGQITLPGGKKSSREKWTALQPRLPPECATTNLQQLAVAVRPVDDDDEIEIIGEKRKIFTNKISLSKTFPTSLRAAIVVPEDSAAAPLSKAGRLQFSHIDRFDADDPEQIYINMDIYDDVHHRYMANNAMGHHGSSKRDANGNTLASAVPHSISLPVELSTYAAPIPPTITSRKTPIFLPENLGGIEKLSRSMNFDNENFDSSTALSQGPEPTLILQALTSAKAGDQFNFERLEMLGDCALKMFTTWFLYCRYPHYQEDKMTFAKKILISNAFLCVLAKINELPGAILTQRFDPPNNWMPPCYKPAKKHALHDFLVKQPSSFAAEMLTTQKMRLKTIADCVEALIGAYLLSSGPFAARVFMHAFGMHVFPFAFDDANGIKRRWSTEKLLDECRGSGYTGLFNPTTTALIKVVDVSDTQRQILLRKLLCSSEQLEVTICYTFRDKSFLLQALTHPAYTQNRITGCYQRLEFLGDALIDYVITQYIFRKRLDATPGDLTDMRAALTNNTLFATIVVQKRLYTYLKHRDGKLHTKIRNFVSWVCGDDEAGGSDAFRLTLIEQYFNKTFEKPPKIDADPSNADVSKPNRIVLPNNVKIVDELEDVEAPKALGDLMESLAGAIYLDSGRSLQAVWKFVCRMMHDEILAFTADKPPKNHKRELYELMPSRVTEIGSELKADGRIQHVLMLNDHQIAFRGVGASKNVAANAAAKCALAYLQKQKTTA